MILQVQNRDQVQVRVAIPGWSAWQPPGKVPEPLQEHNRRVSATFDIGWACRRLGLHPAGTRILMSGLPVRTPGRILAGHAALSAASFRSNV